MLKCIAAIAVIFSCLAAVAAAAEPPRHFLHAGTMPPGAIGAVQLQRGGPLAGYYQPVEIRAPQGVTVSLVCDGQFTSPQAAPVKVALLVGPVYRLRVTGIPRREGDEVYPTIEVINRLYPPVGEELRFPIPIELTEEDLRLALDGKLVTRVIYLEDPRAAYARQEDPDVQYVVEASPKEDPLLVADRLGRPMAIVRIGGRVPVDTANPDADFLYHSPPLLRFARYAGAMPRSLAPNMNWTPDLSMSRAAPSATRPTQRAGDPDPGVNARSPGSAQRPAPPDWPTRTTHVSAPLDRSDRWTILGTTGATMSARSRLQRLLVAIGCLGLCSCRMTPPQTPIDYMSHRSPAKHISAGGPGYAYAALPLEAYTGHAADGYTMPAAVPRYMQGGPVASETILTDDGLTDPSVLVSNQRTPLPCGLDQVPLPDKSCGPWRPAGIAGPWPEDEYLFDGGDADAAVKVRSDWQLEGLDPEDTIAHYDTLDGRTVVKPACRVCLYAPRFAAVRQVLMPFGDNQIVKAGGLDSPVIPLRENEIQPVTTVLQPIPPAGELGHRGPVTFLERQPPVGLIARTVIRATVDRLKPYENFDLIRWGEIIEAEKPFLAVSVQAAITWTLEQGVEVAIAGRKAVVLDGEKRAQATYGSTPGKPCLRICKVASSHSAKPGEIVEFTLRFDNIGQETVGNVTIVDNLTTRLELVPDSGQCSKQAQFFTEENRQGSLILRWEIADPIKPGEGGICRFKCVVR